MPPQNENKKNNYSHYKKKIIIIIRFPIETVEDVCSLYGAGQNRALPLVPLAPHGEVAKALHVVRLATKVFLVSVDAVFGLELLATKCPTKHMATVLPN